MIEISREECINTINKWLSCDDCDFNECFSTICSECKHFYDGNKVNISLKQAISDMEKLEKIEKIINNISDYEYEDCYFDLRMIEKIVKGEQNE